MVSRDVLEKRFPNADFSIEFTNTDGFVLGWCQCHSSPEFEKEIREFIGNFQHDEGQHLCN